MRGSVSLDYTTAFWKCLEGFLRFCSHVFSSVCATARCLCSRACCAILGKKGGSFTRELTLEEMVESNLQDLEHWNRANGLHLTQEEARQGLKDFLPALRRWRGRSSPRSGSEE